MKKKILRNYRIPNQEEFNKECEWRNVKASRLNEREILLEGSEYDIWKVIEYLENLQH